LAQIPMPRSLGFLVVSASGAKLTRLMQQQQSRPQAVHLGLPHMVRGFRRLQAALSVSVRALGASVAAPGVSVAALGVSVAALSASALEQHPLLDQAGTLALQEDAAGHATALHLAAQSAHRLV
jgi:hypothetical protein